MQKIQPIIKRLIIFLALAITVPWLNMAVFFALYSYDADEETKLFIKENSQNLYDNGYTASLLAFILTYFIAIHFINRKIKRKLWRLLLYVLINIVCFIGLSFLP